MAEHVATEVKGLVDKFNQLLGLVNKNRNVDPYIARNIKRLKKTILELFHGKIVGGRAMSLMKQLDSELDWSIQKSQENFWGDKPATPSEAPAPDDREYATQETIAKIRPYLEKILTREKPKFVKAGRRDLLDQLIVKAKQIINKLSQPEIINSQINRALATFAGVISKSVESLNSQQPPAHHQPTNHQLLLLLRSLNQGGKSG